MAGSVLRRDVRSGSGGLWSAYYGVLVAIDRFGLRNSSTGAKCFALANQFARWALSVCLSAYGRPLSVRGQKMFPVGSGSSSLGVTLRLLTNSYEPGTTQLLEAVLRPGMTVVDIGAHVGYFTLLASRLVGPTGRVFAFEPEPHTFDLLQRNIAVNGLLNVVPVKKAVAGRTGELKLFLCLQGSDRNSLFEPSDRGQSVNIDAVAVDEFWLALGCPTFDLLKIDAEGAESSVIEGMTSVLARCGVCRMIVELNPLALDRAGANPLRLLQMIGDSNFAIQEIKDDGPLRAIEPSEYPVLLQDLRQRKESINLFCVHHENGPNLQRRPVKTRTEMLG